MIGFLAASILVLGAAPSHVMDMADVLTLSEEASLESKLAAFERGDSVEVVFATYASLNGADGQNQTRATARRMNLGSSTGNRAVLVAFYRDDREISIEISDGLGSKMNSSDARRIIDSQMIPYFKSSGVAPGFEAGAREIMNTIRGNASAYPSYGGQNRNPSGYSKSPVAKVLSGMGTVGLIVIVIMIRVGLGAVGLGGRRRSFGWGSGYRSSSWGGSSWGSGSSRSSWGGGSSSRSSGGGFSGRGASGKW